MCPVFRALYIGGMPEEMFKRPAVTSLIESRKGFRGCLASVDLNGMVPELMNYARDRTNVLDGCTGTCVNFVCCTIYCYICYNC